MADSRRRVKVFVADTGDFKKMLMGKGRVTNIPETAYIQDFHWDMQLDEILIKVHDDSFPIVPDGMMYPREILAGEKCTA